MASSENLFASVPHPSKFSAKHNNQGNVGWAAAFENFLVLWCYKALWYDLTAAKHVPGPILAGCNVRTLFAVCLGSAAKSCSLVPSTAGVHVRSSVSPLIEGCTQPQLVHAESSSRLSRCPFAFAHREPLKSHISAALDIVPSFSLQGSATVSLMCNTWWLCNNGK